MSKKDRRPDAPAAKQPSEPARSVGERASYVQQPDALADTDPRANKTITQNDSLNDLSAASVGAQAATAKGELPDHAVTPPAPPAATPFDAIVKRDAALPADAPVKVQCSTCQYGQDTTLGGLRRCRANPPQAHFVNRMFGDKTTSGAHAIGMWPVVEDWDACGHWQNVDLS